VNSVPTRRKPSFLKVRDTHVRPDLRLVLLREIADHGPGHGLSLHERLVASGNPQFLRRGIRPGAWKASKDLNSLYPVLRELEREGYLTHQKTEPLPERGGRPRIIYSITDAGRRLLEAS
jgi:DNA-binding PadR family transcriptional regulator